jgi:hypothetical protein
MSDIEWICISPAELSTACCAKEMKFVVNGDVIYQAAVTCDSMFTQVITIAASLYRSIYDIEVWGGYGPENKTQEPKNRTDKDDEWEEFGQIA